MRREIEKKGATDIRVRPNPSHKGVRAQIERETESEREILHLWAS